MVKYCFDTGIIIAFFRNDEKIVKKMKTAQENNDLFITPITLCELYKGAYKSSNKKYELSFIDNVTEALSVLKFDNESCKVFGEDFVRLEKSGKSVDDFDIMVCRLNLA